MSEDVAAVLAQIRSALTTKVTWAPQERVVEINKAIVAFDELFSTHAVVALPEGVEVAHGAQLVTVRADAGLFAIEPCEEPL